MKKPLLPYAQHAANLNIPVSDRSRLLATAVALAIACRIPVPSEELDSPAEHYSFHIAPTALRIVSAFNEATILDLRYAEEIGRNFWLQRYEVLHNCPTITGQTEFFSEVYGVHKFFAENEVSFFNSYRAQIGLLYSVVCPVVEEMLGQND